MLIMSLTLPAVSSGRWARKILGVPTTLDCCSSEVTIMRLRLAAILVLAFTAPADAQVPSWAPWYQPGVNSERSGGEESSPPLRYNRNAPGPKLLEGGSRPSISPRPPEPVSFPSNYAPGTIIIDTAGRRLFLVQSSTRAYRYPISVGRQGFTWTGRETISRIADWPDWHPPKEMRERDPSLPEKMTGGIHNPLGAKALYLGNSLYRIHGTNSAQTIGRANSSGCFRMTNAHVLDLARRVRIGTPVVVLKSLPGRLARTAYE
jgi:lipoprotein-anchoring transpeptidase ErfK/SrfK